VRVICAGSRHFEGPWAVKTVGEILQDLWTFAIHVHQPLILVHGDCPTGADRLVDLWGSRRSDWDAATVVVERWPADWRTYGKAAGPRRNEAMVKAGGDMCVGFIRDNSAGTAHTLRLAREAGIATFSIDWNDQWL
jgi:hypothetical protein